MKYLPVTIARAANYECDDVIGTLCDNLKDEDVTVLSGDSDFIQLLQRGYNNCKVYSPIKKSFMSAPDYPYVAWKCLSGDSADNIPGFKGIGDKTAQKLLKDPEKFKKFMAVEENRAQFSIFRQLIEFRSVPEDEIVLVEGVRDFLKLKDEFNKMKFASITNDTSWNKYTKTFDCIKF
jgi:5'-3' exonuclease